MGKFDFIFFLKPVQINAFIGGYETMGNQSEKYQLHDVFTPNRPARLTFVERPGINEALVNALQTPGKQIIVYGHSGSGKTTLLANKLEQIYENHLTTRCIKHLTLEHLLLDAFDQLDPFYGESATTTSKRVKGTSLGVDYKILKLQVNKALEEQKASTVKRFLPPTLTPQTLARLMGAANLCWVLEDFHKITNEEKSKLAQAMKIFMDEADNHKYLKIVAIGAVDTARQVIEYDAEMRHRVAEIHIPLMTDAEIRQIITRGESLLNFQLSEEVKEGTIQYANGLAAVCHGLCLNICQAIGLVETLASKVEVMSDHLECAVQAYLREMEDTIKAAFDRALRKQGRGKFDSTEPIILTLAQSPQEGASEQELLVGIRHKLPRYREASLRRCLQELQTEQRGFLLRYDQDSGRYSFRDPIFRTV
ncbi:MAG: hypothetical protein V1908_04455, partial [Candidatus Peregrinibacteria bacterium]